MLAVLDGEAAAVERYNLEEHLRGCATCRAEATELRRLHEALAALPQASTVPVGLESASMRGVRAARATEKDDRSWVSALGGWWWSAVPLAATLALVVSSRLLVGPDAEQPVEVALTTSSAVSDKPSAPVAKAASEATVIPPTPVAETPVLFLDMPLLENMEKLQNFETIRTVDVGTDALEGDGRG
jgi:anti-sigma factor RsiW